MSTIAVIEGITAILTEMAKQKRTEYVAYDNVAMEMEWMGKKIKFVVNGSVYRTVWSDAQQAPDDTQQQAPDDAEQQAPAPDNAPPWDQEPLLDMGCSQMTVMTRWLRHKKLLRQHLDVASKFLLYIDASSNVSWPTIRPPATGGATRIPLALCYWYLEQVDQANDGRLEAALAWIDACIADPLHGTQTSIDAMGDRIDAITDRIYAASPVKARPIGIAPKRDAEGDKPQSGWTPPPGFPAYLAGLRGTDDPVVIAHKAHMTVIALKKLEKGITHKHLPRSALLRLAAVYGVDTTKMLKKAGCD
jgi:hypothetical protein